MFCQTQLIRLPGSFGLSATVEMITLSEVFSILTIMCHRMPPTNCTDSLRGMTASACHWLASNTKPFYQPASSHGLNLVVLQRDHLKSNNHSFFLESAWLSCCRRVYPEQFLLLKLCEWAACKCVWVLLSSLTAVVLRTQCQEHYAVLFCCHVCPWCLKIHKE